MIDSYSLTILLMEGNDKDDAAKKAAMDKEAADKAAADKK
jgi:hypothetical protein